MEHRNPVTPETLSGWKVTLVHGSGVMDEKSFENLQDAMEWARMKGSEYHKGGVDCLGRMMEVFVKEDFSDGATFQYGTDYHWVTFERIKE